MYQRLSYCFLESARPVPITVSVIFYPTHLAGFFLDIPQPFLVDQQRLSLATEFLAAMDAAKRRVPKFGVLLSGPNGVGKSSVGVATFLAAFVQGEVVLYINHANDWVEAAKEGDGDRFFVETLIRQNVDLIISDPVLRSVLAPVLVGGAGDTLPYSDVMDELRRTIARSPRRAVGVIVDEVQVISQAIAKGEVKHSLEDVTAEGFFRQWHTWDTRVQVFVRMDIASSHGVRELKMPSGEAHRLRIIKPWTADVVTAATTMAGSPLQFDDRHTAARERIVFTGGGIPRTLFRGKELLAQKERSGLSSSDALNAVATELEVDMKDCCHAWFESLDQAEKDSAADGMLQLVRGEVVWNRVKGLYDEGLVARCGEGSLVTPVSSVAASVIIRELSFYLKDHRKPLSSLEPTVRGHELERQVIVSIPLQDHILSTKTFDAAEGPKVHAKADQVLVFDSIAADVKAMDGMWTLYVPRSTNYPCDIITIPPPGSDPSVEIVVWETSVTDPRASKRVEKCLKWFEPGGIIEQLRKAHPTRPIVCALCWPENLTKDASRKHEDLTAKADSVVGMGVRMAVVDIVGLQELKVIV